MGVKHEVSNEQTRLWNGLAGNAWVDAQAVIDQMYKPIEDMLVDAAAIASPGRLLDVGCGTGGTTVAVARKLGTTSRCVGVDISEPMIAAARLRAEQTGMSSGQARFICGNAESYAFDSGSFDMIVSRFGVMFFDDPVGAFANLRRAAADDAALRLIVWRGPAENPFMTTAERAAAPLLPNIPPRVPDAPGQFGLANDERLAGILKASGWADIALEPVDVACAFPESALVPYLTRFGPVGRVFNEADERTQAVVIDTVRAAFEPYVHGADVRFTAACWTVSARAPIQAKTGSSA